MINEDKYIHTKRQAPMEKKVKTQQQMNAAAGKFPFKEFNGFVLKEVQWTVPDKKERKARRHAFGKVRTEFLKHIGATMEPQLRALGLSDNQIDQIKKGTTPPGYNVHHKLPIHGGGKNEFSNLILMPIPPHDALHHTIMDPQVAQMQSGDSKKVVIPWSDDMVYVRPEQKTLHPHKAIMAAKLLDAHRGR